MSNLIFYCITLWPTLLRRFVYFLCFKVIDQNLFWTTLLLLCCHNIDGHSLTRLRRFADTPTDSSFRAMNTSEGTYLVKRCKTQRNVNTSSERGNARKALLLSACHYIKTNRNNTQVVSACISYFLKGLSRWKNFVYSGYDKLNFWISGETFKWRIARTFISGKMGLF